MKVLSSYSLSLIDMSRLTPMNKTILDVDHETLNPKTIFIILCSDTKFVMTRDHLVVVTGVFDLSEVLYKPLAFVIAFIIEK